MRLCCALVFLIVACVAQENTPSISGKVADERGFAIPDVVVTLFGQALLEVRSDDLGKFAFSSLEPGVYQLKFHMTGFWDQLLNVTMKQQPIVLGEVVLHIAYMGHEGGVSAAPVLRVASENGSIYGVVRHGSAGVAKAVVVLQLSGESAQVKTTRTDAIGNFQLDEVKGGLCDITIEATGFKTAKVDLIGLQHGRDVILPLVQLFRPTSPIH